VLPANAEEVAEGDLALVFLISSCFHVNNEGFPVVGYLAEQLAENLDCLVLVHFLMQHAEVLIVLRRLPALIVVAAVNLALLRLVLAEIQPFGREHL